MAAKNRAATGITARASIAPFLKRVTTLPDTVMGGGYPLDVPAFRHGIDIQFRTPVTFLIGDNGSGKSTLLEALADKCGFGLAGGSRNHVFEHEDTEAALSPFLRAAWSPKVTDGFFLRAETFFNFGSYIETIIPKPDSFILHEGRDSVQHQSHGEFFLALFLQRRFRERGMFILDEPEAALSPASQLAFLTALRQFELSGNEQFIIATHSPILLCYPGATVISLSCDGIREIDYRETEHFKITREFLNCPERYFKEMFEDGDTSILTS